jgi:hypothetical protein
LEIIDREFCSSDRLKEGTLAVSFFFLFLILSQTFQLLLLARRLAYWLVLGVSLLPSSFILHSNFISADTGTNSHNRKPMLIKHLEAVQSDNPRA